MANQKKLSEVEVATTERIKIGKVLDLEKKYALPRAYTTQQSESMKSLSDMIYGYYSHEKKALI